MGKQKNQGAFGNRVLAATALFMAVFLTAAAGQAAGQTLASALPPVAGGDSPMVGIDNRELTPKYQPDAAIAVESGSPDWVKTLGYGNFGPDRVEPLLTGTAVTDFSAVKKFMEAAHQRNIRVLFYIIVWGTRKDSLLVTQHPEFYGRKKDGSLSECWDGYGFDWSSPALKHWFKAAAMDFILRTGADGFRVGLAPDTSGYFFREIRDELYARDRKVIIVSEISNERKDAFDFEQNGVTGWMENTDFGTPGKFEEPKNGSDLPANISSTTTLWMSSGRAGESAARRCSRGETAESSDITPRIYCATMILFPPPGTGYALRMAPSSPRLFPCGGSGRGGTVPEFGCRARKGGCMYFNTIDWSQLKVPENRAFYEDVKRYIRIRRSFPQIFECFPDNHREANIVKVDTRLNGMPNRLQAYGRFAAGQAVLAVPNDTAANATAEIRPDCAALGLGSAASRKATDLMTGKEIGSWPVSQPLSFTAEIAANHLGMYLLERNQ